MQADTEAQIGKVTLEKVRKRRDYSDRRIATLKCDAACVDDDRRVLLLSVVAPESVLKALRATLVGDEAITVDIQLPGVVDEKGVERGALSCYSAETWEEGYTFRRAKIIDGLWHGVLLAKARGFMPALTEEALWQELRSERFTTPVVRAWVPWLMEQLKEAGLATLRSAGCNPGLLTADDELLDRLVAAGLKSKALRIPEG